MAYKVGSTLDCYETENDTYTQDLEDWLNAQEADGWTLVGVLPPHYAGEVTDDQGEEIPQQAPAMLILHRP